LVANDVHREPRYCQHPSFENICSQLAVPIQLRGQMIGVLEAGSEELNAFDQSDLDTLETLAAQFAMAMENVRLHQKARRHSVEH
ncbi:MAG: GAF domain-containing protein, partial [Anaerolineae bacterium]|nr:GAF domain-containing protein [Anaerolineae bacterium]